MIAPRKTGFLLIFPIFAGWIERKRGWGKRKKEDETEKYCPQEKENVVFSGLSWHLIGFCSVAASFSNTKCTILRLCRK